MVSKDAFVKNFLPLSLAISLVGRLAVLHPLNAMLLAGSDFMGHVPVIWFMKNFLSLGWDQFWYGGYPIIKYVSPLPQLAGSFFALFGDPVIAYKIVIDLVFLLAPAAFYILIKGFNLTNAQKAIGVLLFSFFPANMHYFSENSFPTVMNILFSLLVWKSALNYAEKSTAKNLGFAGMFFAFSLLINQLTAFFNIILVFAFCILKYRKMLFAPVVLGSLIAGFWFFPFLLEYSGDALLKQAPGFGPLFSSVIHDVGIFGVSAIAALASAAIIYMLLKKRDMDAIGFAAVFLIIGGMIFFTSYMRIISIASLPIAFLVSKISGNKVISIFAIASIVVFAFLFYTLQNFSYLHEYQEWEAPPANDRVIYYPQGPDFCESYSCDKSVYSAYSPIEEGQLGITGVRIQYLTIGNVKESRAPYFEKIFNPLNRTDKELSGLLAAGFVNTVVVNKNFPEYVKYFNGSKYFKKTNETEHFFAYALEPQSSFLEIDSAPVEANVARGRDSITISFACSPGELTIKESYDDYWSAQLAANGGSKALELKPNNYGFTETHIAETGQCTLEMSYRQKMVYYAFFILSAVAFVPLLFWNRIKMFLEKLRFVI